MTAEERSHDGGVPEDGSEAHASGPEPDLTDDLTVEDILAADQSDDAADADADASGAADSSADEADSLLDDLRRVTAEYANYRKRTEANALLEKQRASASVLSQLLPLLDDIDRADEHGDLVEGSAFATIAQKFRGVLERMGLEGFGEKGEAFDPKVHEAIAQVPVPGTEEQTVLDVVERGYRIGDVELRPAKVAVAVAAGDDG